MEINNILIISGAVIIVIVLWIVISYKNLKHLKLEIGDQWEILDESLRKRQDLIPNLIETIRIHVKDKEVIMEKLVADRRNAALEYEAGSKKIELEHEMVGGLNMALELGKLNVELSRDTNFLELKTEIGDLGNNIEVKARRYNEMVRYYNKSRSLFLMAPIALIFGFKVINIFEVES
ncbi:MAG: LemA family protein [Patescibacteria group bacterium]